MSQDPPKTAVELAMERLQQGDAAAGGVASPLSDEQKAAIGAARRDYEAKVAEADILFRSKLLATFDPDARLELEANHRRDLAQFASSRDKKIATIREAGGSA